MLIGRVGLAAGGRRRGRFAAALHEAAGAGRSEAGPLVQGVGVACREQAEPDAANLVDRTRTLDKEGTES